ncbi:malate synthase A [Rhodoplanes sp. SY1]|uniref:malate synthase A n=1 Tax=Rhodoplanes sp. SY1 TaxID=3166646 RepID=UPI0038B60859
MAKASRNPMKKKTGAKGAKAAKGAAAAEPKTRKTAAKISATKAATAGSRAGKTSKPAKPATATKPAKPVKASKPAKRAVKPAAKVAKPAKPAKPAKASRPVTSAKTAKAAKPAKAARAATRAAVKPAGKSAKPVAPKAAKVAAKAAPKGAVKAAAKPSKAPTASAKPVTKPAAKSAAKPAAKPATKPATKPAAKPAKAAAKTPAAKKPAEAPAAMSSLDIARERAAGRVKRAVRRVVATVADAAASALKPAPRPASALRPSEKKPRAERPRARGGAVPGVVVKGRMGPRYPEILSPGALAFLAELHRRFDGRRRELLAARAERQARFDAGELPDFLPETAEIRSGDWKVGPIPADLQNRRVEITGPVDRKMIVNALNSGATHFMADFEDANSPTWSNCIEGQLNLRDRWDGKIDFTDETSGKRYAIGDNPAVLIIRPRGWHLLEEHVTVDGEPMSGSLFDFGLYFFHNAKALLAKGSGPYFYIPKLESHLEARLWNDVFLHAQEKLGIPKGTIKATVLIETLPAGFEMDEILYELRDHAAGLNAGRWDYIFSFIKKLAKRPDYVLPDRGQVVMGKAFLGAYALLLIKTCHRRGAFAMGGMAAQIPIKGDPAANEAAFAKVRADKEREVNDGHDGTWVAHPDLVPVAKEVFDRLMPQPNQVDRQRDDVEVGQTDLLRLHEGSKTEEGFRLNIRVGVQYIEAWLRGRGAVPIYNLMEDAATAEISRAQIWQWLQYGAVLENGVTVTPELFDKALGEEMERVRGELGAEAYDAGRFPEAIELFRRLSLAPEFEDFLTVPAYQLLA